MHLKNLLFQLFLLQIHAERDPILLNKIENEILKIEKEQQVLNQAAEILSQTQASPKLQEIELNKTPIIIDEVKVVESPEFEEPLEEQLDDIGEGPGITEIDPESCNSDTKWMPCSKLCGLGVQVRYKPNADCTDYVRETRLCHDRFCLADSPFPVMVTKPSYDSEKSRKIGEKRKQKLQLLKKFRKRRRKKDRNNGGKSRKRKNIGDKRPKNKKIVATATASASANKNTLTTKYPTTNNYPKTVIRKIKSTNNRRHMILSTQDETLSNRVSAKFCRTKKNITIRPKIKSKIAYAGCLSKKSYRLNYCTDTCGNGQRETCCSKHRVKSVSVKFYCDLNKILNKKMKQLKMQKKLRQNLRLPSTKNTNSSQIWEPDSDSNQSFDFIKLRQETLNGVYAPCKKTRKGLCTFTKNMEIIKSCKCSKKTACPTKENFDKIDRRIVYGQWNLSFDMSRS